MFEPGHLHHASPNDLANQPVFTFDLYYEVRNDAKEGPMLHCRMIGEVDGVSFEESFELHSDTAFNFASITTRLAAKHGLPSNTSLIMHNHQEFDAMFADIRHQLGAHSGDPVNLNHLPQDGL
ncbi:MAG: DUF5064 family protein [Pseudomonas sp.]